MSSQEEQARALRDALLKDMQARKGFRRDHVDTETRNEWDEKWLDIITAALTQATPQWSSEKLTKPGWYWWIADEVPNSTMLPVIVYVSHDFQISAQTLRIHGKYIDEVNGQFAGPLATPEETAS